MSEEKEKNINNKSQNKEKEELFETAYEKVLYIINKVKDFIKTISKNENKLIEELDWVIKIITNRSLYTYELVKEKMLKQNEEYNKYINFIKKYNEEVIEMNKKHDIVNSILNITKKEEVLLKPSLFLKKIDNINKVGEIKQKKKNGFVHTFGNYILNLYKKYKMNDNKKKLNLANNNEDKNENIENKNKDENKSNINEIIKDVENESNNHINKQDETKKESNQNNQNNNDIIPKRKRVCFENNKSPKKENSDKNVNLNVNIQKIKVLNNKTNIKSKSNIKLLSLNLNEISRKKNKERLRLTKIQKNDFNQIKNIMKNYYINNAYNEQQLISTGYPYLFKNDLNNIKQNIMPIEVFKRYRNEREKTYNVHRTIRQSMPFSPQNINNKTKNNFTKNSKVSLSLQTNVETNDEKFEINNNKTSKNYFKTEKIYIQDKSQDNQKYLIKNDIKIGNNNQIYEQKNNIIKNTFDINIKKNDKSISLDTLINDNFNDVKNITSFDFNIFELKKIIGYNNVLPLMGYTILKTLGLVDNKIISTKKLESFLRTVSDNYKITTLYHNSLHGADVTQSLMIFFLNSNSEEICETTVLDLLGMIISAMGHDLGHPGLNNGYHINASTELGLTYNDHSCLENFHTSYLFRILRKEENNIFEKFSVQNYKAIRKRMISQIIATDMAYHGENISSIRAKIRTSKEQERFIFLSGNDKTKFDEQQLLLNYLIHMADLGHNCKKFEISVIWIQLLCEEFWEQGDREREKGLPISFMCDRNNIDVPNSQIGFLKGFILSSFECLVEMFPKLHFTIDNAENNIKQWTKFQSEKKLLGWSPKKDKEEKDKENKDI